MVSTSRPHPAEAHGRLEEFIALSPPTEGGERHALFRTHASVWDVPASATLQLGQRVIRKDTTERGIVVATTNQTIKVKWDRGRTSYFRRGAEGNVLHAPTG